MQDTIRDRVLDEAAQTGSTAAIAAVSLEATPSHIAAADALPNASAAITTYAAAAAAPPSQKCDKGPISQASSQPATPQQTRRGGRPDKARKTPPKPSPNPSRPPTPATGKTTAAAVMAPTNPKGKDPAPHAAAPETDGKSLTLIPSAPLAAEPATGHIQVAKQCAYENEPRGCVNRNCTYMHTLPRPLTLAHKNNFRLPLHLRDDQFAEISSHFPMLTLYNPPGPSEPSLHPMSRCARAAAEHYLSTKITNRKVLNFQGQERFNAKLLDDTCRKGFTIHDLNQGVQLCNNPSDQPGLCIHDVNLQNGKYDTLVMVDVPINPADLKKLFDHFPRIVEIYMLLHVYDQMVGHSAEQTYIWHPAVTPTIGSAGTYVVSTPGATTVVEPDHHWLTAGYPLLGVAAEGYFDIPAYNYKCYRVFRKPVDTDTRLDINSSTYLKTPGPLRPATICGMEAFKFSKNFSVITLDNQRMPIDNVELKNELAQISGRETNEAMRTRIAVRAQRVSLHTDLESLIAVTCEIKRCEEMPFLESQFRPITGANTWFSWFRRNTRRSIDAHATALRRGETVPQTYGLAYLIASIISLLLFVLPWPSYINENRLVTYFQWITCNALPDALSHYYLDNYYWSSEWARYLFPTHRIFTLTYTIFQIPARCVFIVLFFFFFITSASGLPLTAMDVRPLYTDDMFAPIPYTGPLPGPAFGLPGYISSNELTQVADDCEVIVREYVPDPSPTDKLFAIGLVFGYRMPTVAIACQTNMLIAVHNRQCAIVPQPDPEYFAIKSQEFLANFPDSAIPNLGLPNIHTFEEWNDRMKPHKRLLNIAARDRLASASPPTTAEIYTRKAFMKIEKICQRKHYDPRCITAASDEWNVLFGPYIMTIASRLKSWYNYTNRYFFAMSTSPDELGKWFAEAETYGGAAVSGDDQIIVIPTPNGPIYIEIDGKRHDSRMNELFLMLKWLVYDATVPIMDPMKRDFLYKGQATTYARTGLGVAFTHPFRVRSGDADTSIGNSIDTMFIAQTVEKLFTTTAYIKGATEKYLIDEILKLGYNIEINITREPDQVTFLSGLFIPVNGRNLWCLKPGRLLARLGWTERKLKLKDLPSILRGNALSFKSFMFVPFLRVVLATMLRVTSNVTAAPLPEMYHRVSNVIDDAPDEPGLDTWNFMFDRYRLTQQQEIEFAQQLQNCTTLPYMYSGMILDYMLDIDQ